MLVLQALVLLIFCIILVLVLFQKVYLIIAFCVIGIILSVTCYIYMKHLSFSLKMINDIKEDLKALARRRYETLKLTKSPFSADLKAISKALLKQDLKIQKRTKKLKLLNEQQAKSLHAISHELKNPLSIINASVHTLKNYPASMDKKLQLTFLQKIENGSAKIDLILTKLSLTSSLEQGFLNINLESIRLDKLLEELCASALSKIDISLKKIPKTLLADRILLEQVLINLLQNAGKHAKKKVYVEIKTRFLEIYDDGGLMNKDSLKMLGKKFYKTKTSQEVRDHSLGLGLFIVKEIIKLHNWRIFFSIKKGYGLRVRIYY
ncbi:hypothetical protein BKH43_01745 [Helicobacter sp. 13S00401-1]|uniref:sensor histidine kinase n=1 Tax=Helicobacter sp. 13S00401-1 TaxID=1905758 RepID=UPI000BA509BB|nr:HAMP domain-containing sensor histidine kinase [Helicobacter sp. 13S00401-1]PAF51389.1 hypothetical protein BKH43_01745 [Helicobacter sp. 13S00401-1]